MFYLSLYIYICAYFYVFIYFFLLILHIFHLIMIFCKSCLHIWIVCSLIPEGRICHTTLYQGLSPSLGIVSIPYGPVQPETSALVIVSHIQFIVFNTFTNSCLFWNMFSTRPV